MGVLLRTILRRSKAATVGGKAPASCRDVPLTRTTGSLLFLILHNPAAVLKTSGAEQSAAL
jgi:hypothetical protein